MNSTLSSEGVCHHFGGWHVGTLAATAVPLARLSQPVNRDSSFVAAIVGTSGVHAMLIEGTMEIVSKSVLCVLVLAATIKALIDLRVWTKRATSR